MLFLTSSLKGIHNIIIWITKTTRAGDTNARIGIAEHLSGDIVEIDIPSQFLSPQQIKTRLLHSGALNKVLPQWPDVFIGPCFHIPYMQEIKRLSKNKTLVVALRPPVRGLEIKANKNDIACTDIIVSYPYHDNSHLPNLLVCESVANRITEYCLREAQKKWNDQFSPFLQQGPVIGLLVGGDVGEKRRIFSPDIAKALGQKVNDIAKTMGASIIASVSARTSREMKKALHSQITVPCYMYDPKEDTGDNPYFGILSSANYLVVTADSISMCCEATSSGKPVYIFLDESIIEDAHLKIAHYLIDKKQAHLLNEQKVLKGFNYKPLNSAAVIANKANTLLLQARSHEQSKNSVTNKSNAVNKEKERANIVD